MVKTVVFVDDGESLHAFSLEDAGLVPDEVISSAHFRCGDGAEKAEVADLDRLLSKSVLLSTTRKFLITHLRF